MQLCAAKILLSGSRGGLGLNFNESETIYRGENAVRSSGTEPMAQIHVGSVAVGEDVCVVTVTHHNEVISFIDLCQGKISQTVVRTVVFFRRVISAAMGRSRGQGDTPIWVDPSIQPLCDAVSEDRSKDQVSGILVRLAVSMTDVDPGSVDRGRNIAPVHLDTELFSEIRVVTEIVIPDQVGDGQAPCSQLLQGGKGTYMPTRNCRIVVEPEIEKVAYNEQVGRGFGAGSQDGQEQVLSRSIPVSAPITEVDVGNERHHLTRRDVHTERAKGDHWFKHDDKITPGSGLTAIFAPHVGYTTCP